MTEKNEVEIPIHLDNFEALALKYRPVMLSNIKKVHKMHDSTFRVEFDDLLQEANLALYDSIRHFDPTRSIFFGHYLKIAISNRLKCFCRNTLPHFYSKDIEKSTPDNPKFKRERVQVGSIDEVKSYNL